MASLENLSTDELIKIRKNLDQLIKEKFDKDLGKRQGQRTKVKIVDQAEIERKKEFFINYIKFSSRKYPSMALCLLYKERL